MRDDLDERVLENLYSRLEAFSADPEFSVIKNNTVRTVLFYDSGRILVKLYKKGSLFQKIKHLAIPSKARSEWQNLKHFNQKGLPCPAPLAFSERKQFGLLEESYLLIKAIPSAFPLNEYFENTVLDPEPRMALILSLSRLIRELHTNHIFYRDLHAGNILIRENPESGCELFFIDLHRAAFPNKISVRMKVKDIAQFFNSISFSGEEQFLFLKEYLEKDNENLELFLHKIVLKQNRLKNTRIKSRSKRCLKNSSVFETQKNSRETYHGRRDFGREQTDQVLDLHTLNRDKNDGTLIKRSEKSIITIIERAGKAPLCIKENRFVNLLYALKNLFRRSRAMKSWIAANGLKVRGIDTPLPLAVIEKRSGPFVKESYMITCFMKNAKEANDYITIFKDPAQKKNKPAFIKAFAAAFKKLHDQGIYHADLKSNNILIKESDDPHWKFYFVDLDRVFFKKAISFYQRANNLAQLNASISALMTAKDRLKFFYFYAKDTHLYTNRKKYYQKILVISRTKITGIYDVQFK